MFQIKTLPVTELQQNCRILWRDGQSDALVIDPGGDASRIEKVLDQQGLVCKEIWLTHSHFDHCGGVADLVTRYGKIKVYGHAIEKEFRIRVEQIKVMYGLTSSEMKDCPEPTDLLVGGETLTFQDLEFLVLFTPGHSPGHLCFYAPAEKFILAGDTLFAGSIGRTDLPGGDFQTLKKSIVEKILTLPDDTRVLSGHGPDTLVGLERGTNPFIVGDFDE